MAAISNWIAGIVMGMLGALFSVFIELMDDYFGLTGDYETTFTLFNDTFSGVNKIEGIAMALGFAILAIIYIWQLFKSLFGPIVKAERPVILTVRAIGFAGFTACSHDLAKAMVALGGTPYKLMKESLSWQSGLLETFQKKVGSGDLLGEAGASDLEKVADYASGFIVGAIAPVINTILFIMLFFAFFKLLFEIIERYLLLALLTIFAPLCIATGVSEVTNSICKNWFKAMISQLLLMTFSIFFLSVMRDAMFNIAAAAFTGPSVASSTALKLILQIMLLVSWARLGTAIDRHMKELGAGALQAGDGLGMAFRNTMGAVRGLSGAGKSVAKGVQSAKSGGGFMAGFMGMGGGNKGAGGGAGGGLSKAATQDIARGKSIPLNAASQNGANFLKNNGFSCAGGVSGPSGDALSGKITSQNGTVSDIGIGANNPIRNSEGSFSFSDGNGNYISTNDKDLAEALNNSDDWMLDKDGSDSAAVAALGFDGAEEPVSNGDSPTDIQEGGEEPTNIPGDGEDGAEYLNDANIPDVEDAVETDGPALNEDAVDGTYEDDDGTQHDAFSNGDSVVTDADGNVIGALNENGEVVNDGDVVGTLSEDGTTFTSTDGETISDCSVNAAVASDGQQVAYDGNGKAFAYADGNDLKDGNGDVIGSIDSKTGEMYYGTGANKQPVEGGHLGNAASADGISKTVSANGKTIGTVGKDGGIYTSDGNKVSKVGFVNESGVACNNNGAQIGGAKIQSSTANTVSANGSTIGTVDKNGDIHSNTGVKIGSVDSNGVARGNNGKPIAGAKVQASTTSTVSANGSAIGTVDKNGNIHNSAGVKVGSVDSNGVARGNDGKPIAGAKVSSSSVSYFGKGGSIKSGAGAAIGSQSKASIAASQNPIRASVNGKINVGANISANTRFGKYDSGTGTRHITDRSGKNVTATYKGQSYNVTADSRGNMFLTQKGSNQKTAITANNSKDIRYNCRFQRVNNTQSRKSDASPKNSQGSSIQTSASKKQKRNKK